MLVDGESKIKTMANEKIADTLGTLPRWQTTFKNNMKWTFPQMECVY